MNASTINNKVLLVDKTTCVTAQKKIVKGVVLFALVLIFSISAIIFSYIHFNPAALDHPAFAENAISGVPELDKSSSYSTLDISEGYSVKICGAPVFDGHTASLYLTNPKENDVWFRAEILDKDKNILASTGVIKQGQYIESVELEKALNDTETPVTVRIVGYTPNTWHSAGSVNLQMVLKLNNK